MFSNLFLLSGKVNCREMSIIGNYPLQLLDNFNIEICFIGVSGISIDHGLTDYTFEEIEIKKQMIRRAKKKIIFVKRKSFKKRFTFNLLVTKSQKMLDSLGGG